MAVPHGDSVYDRIKEEGRAEGVKDTKERYAQISMAEHDDSFEKGRLEGEASAPKRLNWFLFGALVGVLVDIAFNNLGIP